MLKKLIVYCLLFCLPSLAAAKIVFTSNRDGSSNIYVMDDDGSNVQRLTFTESPQVDGGPIWSPDGTHIAFERDTDAAKHKTNQKYDIFLMDADGSNVQQLTDDRALDGSCTWSPDGRRIAFESTRNKGLDIYVMDIFTREVKQLTRNPGNRDSASDPSWSPNGKYIAYEQGINAGLLNAGTTIYVMNADGTGAKALVPPHNEWSRSTPSWSPDSKSVLYDESRFAVVGQITKRVSSNVVIQRHGSKARRVLNIPKKWLVNSVCWMDNGKQVLIAARKSEGIGEQIDIYRYHLVTGQITNLTNHPENDFAMDWISDDVLSVSPHGKKTVQWGTLKK